jgi:Na+-transporting methylmalonyl-CoA/oxaloacetate decarboxylase gamma subunit
LHRRVKFVNVFVFVLLMDVLAVPVFGRLARRWQIVYEARHADQKQEKYEDYIEHQQRVEHH